MKKEEKPVRHRSTLIGIGTNDINAYLLFVYFCIFSNRGERRRRTRSKDEAGNDVSELWKKKNKITHYQLSDEGACVCKRVGAYFDLQKW